MITKNKRYAFTLAEILITLTILGVVTSMIVPNLLQKKPNKQVVTYKKLYGEISKIVIELTNDDELYPYSYSDKILANSRKVFYNGNSYGGAEKFQKLFIEKLKVKTANNHDTTYTFSTMDGTDWSIQKLTDCYIIDVDINGNNHGEDSFETTNKRDKFSTTILLDGTVCPGVGVNRSCECTAAKNSIEKKILAEKDVTKTLLEIERDNNE